MVPPFLQKLFTPKNAIICVIVFLVIGVGILIYRSFQQTSHVEKFANLTFDDLDSNAQSSNSFNVVKGLEDYMKEINKMLDNESATVTISPDSPASCDLDKLCMGIRDPLKLPTKQDTDISGCGWYFKEDKDEHSFPAFGNKDGPLSPAMNALAEGGRWYFYDLSGAQVAEDAKRCDKINSCLISDLYPKHCAWCEVLGKAIPIDDDSGRSKYPNIDNLNCFGRLTKTTDKCKPPKKLPAITNTNGTMVYPEQVPSDICLPENGKMSRGCLTLLAKAAGFLPEGNLLKIINKDPEKYTRANTDNNQRLMHIFDVLKKQARVVSDIEFYGNGNCNRKDVIKYYTEVCDLERFGKTEEVQAAARWLVRNDDFDFEKCTDKMYGPYTLGFLERLFKKHGGQPAGEAYPKEEDIPKYNGKKCSDIKALFVKKCQVEINSPDKKVQGLAIKKCLGIDVVAAGIIERPPFVPNIPCNLVKRSGSHLIGDVHLYPRSGVEIYWYAFNGQNYLTVPDQGASSGITYLGREIRLSLPSFNGNRNFCPFMKYGFQNLIMIARTSITSPLPTTSTTFKVYYNTGVAINVNKNAVMRNWETPCVQPLAPPPPTPAPKPTPPPTPPQQEPTCVPRLITNTVNGTQLQSFPGSPSFTAQASVLIQGPSCVFTGQQFDVAARLKTQVIEGAADNSLQPGAYWALNGTPNTKCDPAKGGNAKAGGCAMTAPMTPGPAIVTFYNGSITGTLTIQVFQGTAPPPSAPTPAPFTQLSGVISRYNSNYYCTIHSIQINSNTVVLNVTTTGDMSMGAIQRPNNSKLSINGASLGKPSVVITKDTPNSLSSILTYNGTASSGMKFTYGELGYSEVPLPSS
jgi:hypothetical protein